MPERGHVARLLPLAAGLVALGHPVHVFTASAYAAQVERTGARFHDVFAHVPLDPADDSFPIPCRYVTYAADAAEALTRIAAGIGVRLVLHDSFAVVGHVVALCLGVPRVHVLAGHALDPVAVRQWVASHPRVHVSAACHRAVDALRARYGLATASPFAYVGEPGADLNVCCEPEEFLSPHEREAMGSVVYFGSLPAAASLPAARPPPSWLERANGSPRAMYASFGTVAWRWYPEDALAAMQAVASAAATRRLPLLISLAGAALPDAQRRALALPGVTVVDMTDQWRALQEADVFVTHCGLNSTHEAVFHGTPMLAYPFFWDQPALADFCARHALGLRVVAELRQPLHPEDVHASLERLQSSRAIVAAGLRRARVWELRCLAGRGRALARVVRLLEGARADAPAG